MNNEEEFHDWIRYEVVIANEKLDVSLTLESRIDRFRGLFIEEDVYDTFSLIRYTPELYSILEPYENFLDHFEMVVQVLVRRMMVNEKWYMMGNREWLFELRRIQDEAL